MTTRVKGALLAPIFLLLPYFIHSECSEIVKYQARGITGYVIEHDNGILTLKIVIDLSVYAKHTSARKRIEKLTLGVLEQIRDTRKMKVIYRRHYYAGGYEVYENSLILPFIEQIIKL